MEDRRFLILCLMGSAGVSVFYTEPIKRRWFFELGVSLSLQVNRAHETTMFFHVVYALELSDVAIKRALVNVTKDLLRYCEITSTWGDVWNGIVVQQHVSLVLD